jgi:DNA (cytosine-5)-methyltransferase 1
MTPTADSFFAGAGLIEIGLEEGGVHVRQSYELDPTCCATLRRNFPCRAVVEGDLARVLGKQARGAEVMVFTYPCTRYSTIGDIHGVRTGDELYLHALRMMALSPPEAYVVENVPGMRKFPVVMEAMTELPDYYVQVFCPVGTQLWLPQRRDRLIIIGTLRPFAFRPPSGTRAMRLAEILEAEPSVEIPPYVFRRLRGQYRDKPIISDPVAGDIAPTCVAHYAKDLSTRLVRDARFPHGVRPYTVREYARLQGVPDWFEFCGTPQDAYRQIGNGVSVPVGRWVGGELVRYFNHCRDVRTRRTAAARKAWATARKAA